MSRVLAGSKDVQGSCICSEVELAVPFLWLSDSPPLFPRLLTLTFKEESLANFVETSVAQRGSLSRVIPKQRLPLCQCADDRARQAFFFLFFFFQPPTWVRVEHAQCCLHSATLLGLISSPGWRCGACGRRRACWLRGKHKNPGCVRKCLGLSSLYPEPRPSAELQLRGDLRCRELCIEDFVQQIDWRICPRSSVQQCRSLTG